MPKEDKQRSNYEGYRIPTLSEVEKTLRPVNLEYRRQNYIFFPLHPPTAPETHEVILFFGQWFTQISIKTLPLLLMFLIQKDNPVVWIKHFLDRRHGVPAGSLFHVCIRDDQTGSVSKAILALSKRMQFYAGNYSPQFFSTTYLAVAPDANTAAELNLPRQDHYPQSSITIELSTGKARSAIPSHQDLLSLYSARSTMNANRVDANKLTPNLFVAKLQTIINEIQSIITNFDSHKLYLRPTLNEIGRLFSLVILPSDDKPEYQEKEALCRLIEFFQSTRDQFKADPFLMPLRGKTLLLLKYCGIFLQESQATQANVDEAYAGPPAIGM